MHVAGWVQSTPKASVPSLSSLCWSEIPNATAPRVPEGHEVTPEPPSHEPGTRSQGPGPSVTGGSAPGPHLPSCFGPDAPGASVSPSTSCCRGARGDSGEPAGTEPPATIIPTFLGLSGREGALQAGQGPGNLSLVCARSLRRFVHIPAPGNCVQGLGKTAPALSRESPAQWSA